MLGVFDLRLLGLNCGSSLRIKIDDPPKVTELVSIVTENLPLNQAALYILLGDVQTDGASMKPHYSHFVGIK